MGSAFQFKVLIADVEMLQRLVAALEELDDVVKVIRGDMEDMLHDCASAFWRNALPDPPEEL